MWPLLLIKEVRRLKETLEKKGIQIVTEYDLVGRFGKADLLCPKSLCSYTMQNTQLLSEGKVE